MSELEKKVMEAIAEKMNANTLTGEQKERLCAVAQGMLIQQEIDKK